MSTLVHRWNSYWRSAGWNEAAFLAGLLVFSLSVWWFLYLGGLAARESFQEVETRWMLAMRNPQDLADLRGPWWIEELARDVSALGSAIVVILMSLFVVGFLCLRRQWGRAGLVAGTIAGGYALSNALKALYGRARPEVVPHLTEVSSASFPSGHSMVSSLAYLTMGALLALTSPSRREKFYFLGSAFLVTFLIGLSRVALGVHYPTDVLAGWCAGTAWALACWMIAWRWRQRSRARA